MLNDGALPYFGVSRAFKGAGYREKNTRNTQYLVMLSETFAERRTNIFVF